MHQVQQRFSYKKNSLILLLGVKAISYIIFQMEEETNMTATLERYESLNIWERFVLDH
jgi:hypothetical protein